MTGSVTWWSDLLRCVTFAFAFLAFWGIAGVLHESRRFKMTRFQVSRFLSLAVFVISTMVTEYLRFGHPASWHTWADLVASILGWFGTSALIRKRANARFNEDA